MLVHMHDSSSAVNEFFGWPCTAQAIYLRRTNSVVVVAMTRPLRVSNAIGCAVIALFPVLISMCCVIDDGFAVAGWASLRVKCIYTVLNTD